MKNNKGNKHNKFDKNKNYKETLPSFFASCSKGLEEELQKELKLLGIEKAFIQRGGVEFKTSIELALYALISTRIASRIYQKVGFIQIADENELYQKSLKVHWDKIFDLKQTFKIKVVQSSSPNGKRKSKFKNSLFLTYKIKDAIVDSFSKRYDERPSIDLDNPDVSFLIHISPEAKPFSELEDVKILLDLSGYPLFKRGYRKDDFRAPLKETLAAGLLSLTDWKPLSEPLVDFMCGSGTFLTEALLMAQKIPPTHLTLEKTKWSFLNQLWFKENKNYQATWERLQKQKKESLNPVQIFGNDIDPQAVKTTSIHLFNLEIPIEIPLTCEDGFEFMPPCENAGVVILNPPYGDRLGDKEELENFYKKLGDHLKHNWKNWRVFVLIGDLELVKKVGLKAHKKHIVFNGPIECRFVEYRLY